MNNLARNSLYDNFLHRNASKRGQMLRVEEDMRSFDIRYAWYSKEGILIHSLIIPITWDIKKRIDELSKEDEYLTSQMGYSESMKSFDANVTYKGQYLPGTW